MSKVLLTGYRELDFTPKDDPNKRIRGFNVFLCVKDNDSVGFVPVDNGGKRFIGEQACQSLGITKKFLDENLLDVINMDVDFNGKIISCSALTDEQRSDPDYPF